MRLYNSDVEEADRIYQEDLDIFEPLAGLAEAESDAAEGDGACKSFFDLRQRTLIGMDQMPAFKLVALGLLRKLRSHLRGSVLYSELEDALGRYFRLLDSDMQRFASLHETLRDAADKQEATVRGVSAEASSAHTAGMALLHEGMREIAVVLLACGEMQRQSLDLKMAAQRSIADSCEGFPPVASFEKYAEFLDEALSLSEQLRRKQQELQQQRIRAMEKITEAKLASAQAGATGGS
eukprot:TRINITY_DN13055_c0_g1_i1.p1 TRINITY_DN13055_c0_g1~~TRINITY_DN13055_c0_g1_i1.p1  ORF type:complete len:237 (-),score=69.74 TRINITY_DN13055_c0_g1_i1:275-985(-)